MKNSLLHFRSGRGITSLRLFILLGLVGASLRLAFAIPGAAYPEETQKKTISVETSSGSFRAEVDSQPAHLRLPLYPGAKPIKGENTGSLDVSLQLSGKPKTRLAVAKYLTSDPMEKVRDFLQAETRGKRHQVHFQNGGRRRVV